MKTLLNHFVNFIEIVLYDLMEIFITFINNKNNKYYYCHYIDINALIITTTIIISIFILVFISIYNIL